MIKPAYTRHTHRCALGFTNPAQQPPACLRALTLTAGHGCPKCAGQYRRSPEDFIKEISEINPDIEIISTFQSTESKITIRCKKCGTTDVLNARSLLNGAGCKQCNYSKLHNDRVMTEEEFIEFTGSTK